jgi:hypothetical protein
MDVSHPIRAVIPTLDGPVLEVLSGTTRSLTASEVHRLCGQASYMGVRKVLLRLASQGLAIADERGNATYYTANREHLAWPAIEALVGLRGQLLNRIRESVDNWTVRPTHVSLYGSAARRDGTAESDIDLLIIRPDEVGEEDEVWATQVDALRATVTTSTGNDCQAFVVDRARLAAHLAIDDPLLHNWLRDEVLIVGDPLGSIVATLGATEQPDEPQGKRSGRNL